MSPLLWLCLAWFSGLLCAGLCRSGAWQAPIALATMSIAAGVAAWALLPSARGRQAGSSALGLLYGAACVAGIAVGPRAAPALSAVPNGIARIEAVVEHAEPEQDGWRSVVRVVRGARLEDGAAIVPGTLLAATPVALPEAARVRVLAKLTARLPFRNPSPHPSLPPRFELQGAAFIPGADAVQVLEQAWLAAWLEAARARVRRALNTSLPARAASVARALVLGDGQALDAEDLAAIRGAGLLHALAVSGLHVAILAGALVWLLRVALARITPLAARFEVRRSACALGVPLAPLYAAFAGGAPSAWRAAITAALAWTLVACGLRPDPAATTAFAALALTAFDPELVTRPAFLLSIVATASVLAAPGATARTLGELLREAFVQSARATLATAPIVLWCFGSVPISGVLANIVLLPFASLVLVQLSALHALICTLSPFGAGTAAVFALVNDAFLNACAVFARFAPSRAWPPPDVAQGLVFAGFTFGLLWLRGLRAWLAWTVAAVACIGALEFWLRAREQPHGRLRLTFLDVGQGDAALIDLPDGKSMLIDAGGSPGGGPDPGARVLVPLLQARRRNRIDLAVLTHPHPDHYGGLRVLLEQVELGELWDSGQAEAETELQPTSSEASQLLRAARAKHVRIRTPAELCGRRFDHAGARIQVLAPCPRYDPGYDANDNSIVLRIDYGRHSVLFTGDAEQHTEQLLLARGGKLRADVLKVAHHGSRSSTSAAFLSAVRPWLAIVSAGAGNRFGHPHAEVLDRLHAVPHVVRLDQAGGTVVESDGRRMSVRTWSGAAWSS